MCVALRLPGGGFKLVFTEADDAIYADDLQQSLAGLNRSIEAVVRVAPEQYQWEYKRFKRQPPGLPPVY
jgi:KDO2-lipid IV(A) lauroyltransferase